jgi:hypothetical protein
LSYGFHITALTLFGEVLNLNIGSGQVYQTG